MNATPSTANAEKLPMFMAAYALNSLRDSGFSLGTALGEVVDNAIEARAHAIRIQLDQGTNASGKRHVHRITVADDGDGMTYDELHHYLQLGYSTRYMSTTTIGKYGVGAKLAALNFGRRVDVWSRRDAKSPWLHCSFDLEEALNDQEQGIAIGIDPPGDAPVPVGLEALLPSGTGTLVVWSKVDRLEEGRTAPDFGSLKAEVEQELSRVFRNFLDGGISIEVNGLALKPHDPLFLMENTWADFVLSKVKKDDQFYGEPSLAELIADEPIQIRGRTIGQLRLTLYPEAVTRKRGLGGDELAKKLRVPENEGAISFVRLGREINYTNVPRIFPRGVSNPDRFIGIEVSFDPVVDDSFGVRNVKRGVEPHNELRAAIRNLLQRYMKVARDRLEERWGRVERDSQEHEGEHAAVLKAAEAVNKTLPQGRAGDASTEVETEQALQDLATDMGKTDEEERKAYIERVKDLPFVMESVDFPGKEFIDIQHIRGQVIIRLNTRHRFYRELWEPIKSMAQRDAGSVSGDEAVQTARRTIEALSLLLIAYGKAESMDDDPREHFEELRSYWGMFLDTMLGKVKGVR